MIKSEAVILLTDSEEEKGSSRIIKPLYICFPTATIAMRYHFALTRVGLLAVWGHQSSADSTIWRPIPHPG